MKKCYCLPIALLLTCASFSQALPFSTLRQVFNYSVGDSFEYVSTDGGSYDIQGSPGIFSCPYYGLMTIISASIGQDTLHYIYKWEFEDPYRYGPCARQWGFSAGAFPPFPPIYGWTVPQNGIISSSDLFSVWAPDSLTTYLWQCISPGSCSDSVFKDGNYNNHKQNQFSEGGLSFLGATFVDSLGTVAMSSFLEGNPGQDTYEQQLIWYHKANGEQWGSAVTIVPTGFDDLNGLPAVAKLFPNPSNGSFKLQLSDIPQTEIYFELFDATGRNVGQKKIAGQQSTFQFGGLSNGLYIWQLLDGDNIISRGKIAIE